MKFFFKIILFVTFFLGMGVSLSHADENVNFGGSSSNTNDSKIDIVRDPGNHMAIVDKGDEGIKDFMLRIAKDAKDLFFFIATIYFLILVFKFLATGKSEEELGNFKKGIIWITIGIVVMQISYSFVRLLYGDTVNRQLAERLVNNMILPLVNVLETGASFFFLAMAIYTFFKLVTAGGNEESVKTGKMTIVYSVIGFIVVKITRTLVESVYGKLQCPVVLGGKCVQDPDLDKFAEILTNIINWANGFIGVITVIMIIYAGYNILFSAGNEEMLKKSKSIILYIAIGIFLLIINYMILTFFLIPDGTIG